MQEARAFAFGSFLLVPERQLLLRDGQVTSPEAIRIGSRAFDLLTALVERPGVVLGRGELMARAWPTTTVGDGNLKVNIGALRRALGDDVGAVRYIATVPGRGYRFIARVEAVRDPGPGASARLQFVRAEPGFDGAIGRWLDQTAALHRTLPATVSAERD
jgi:DNA-binding winged helix-turn-helix (wHTH) protein